MRATSRTNRSAKGGARSSPHYGGEGVLIHPPHQGVCGRHGTEDQGVTPGELPGSSGGTEGSELADDADTRAGYAVRSSSAFWALRSFSTVFAQAEALDATARSLRAS